MCVHREQEATCLLNGVAALDRAGRARTGGFGVARCRCGLSDRDGLRRSGVGLAGRGSAPALAVGGGDSKECDGGDREGGGETSDHVCERYGEGWESLKSCRRLGSKRESDAAAWRE